MLDKPLGLGSLPDNAFGLRPQPLSGIGYHQVTSLPSSVNIDIGVRDDRHLVVDIDYLGESLILRTYPLPREPAG